MRMEATGPVDAYLRSHKICLLLVYMFQEMVGREVPGEGKGVVDAFWHPRIVAYLDCHRGITIEQLTSNNNNNSFMLQVDFCTKAALPVREV